MAKKGGSAPKPPDPAATASAQSAANIEAAIAQGWLNATNQTTPWGSINYSQTGTQRVGDHDVPIFSQNVSLSPAQQRQFDLQNQIQEQALGVGQNVVGNVGNAIRSPFNYEGIPLQPGINDFSADRRRVEDAVLSRFNEDIGAQEAALRTQLANQGIAQGSEAFSSAMKDLDRRRNDAQTQAVLAGGQEQSRLFGLGTAARQQGIQERTLQRSQPVNELATLLGLGSGVQMPQFASGVNAGVAPADVMGATALNYQGQLNNYNQQMARQQAGMGGLFGLGGSIAGALPWGSWF